jgi:hypothetical protein
LTWRCTDVWFPIGFLAAERKTCRCVGRLVVETLQLRAGGANWLLRVAWRGAGPVSALSSSALNVLTN